VQPALAGWPRYAAGRAPSGPSLARVLPPALSVAAALCGLGPAGQLLVDLVAAPLLGKLLRGRLRHKRGNMDDASARAVSAGLAAAG
jgi:hypothetical protein